MRGYVIRRTENLYHGAMLMALHIDGKRLDDPSHVYVIAEAAGSHCQEYEKAEELVYAAANVEVDAVKFQLITPELICADIPLPFGVNTEHDTWLKSLGVTRMRELFAKGGLPREWCKPLKALAESLGIAWLCTPFSVEEAKFLVEDVHVGGLKIASGDLTFTPLLEYAAGTGLPIILSTGGATFVEVADAVYGPLYGAYCDNHLSILHCCSAYPADETIINLNAIKTLSAFNMPIGFSDHTLSVDVVPVLAIANGARIIEKHIRLEHDYESVDAAHSLPPSQFSKFVEVIRQVPAILGHGKKEPHASEMHDRLFARRDPSDWLRPQMRGREGAWE